MTQIRAVVFDMDGVLIDAKEWHYEALNRALALFGNSISRYDHLITYDGLPTRRKLDMLTKERGLPTELHGFLNEMKQMYTMEIIHAKCKPMFQHEYALSNLVADGYKVAVASNSVRNSVEIMMDKANLSKYLSAVLSNEDVANGKPSPEIYEKAFARLGFDPGECLVVEDNENGVRAAREAGGHLLVVRDVYDVDYESIKSRIAQVEQGAQ
ncbi:HAD family phosphatase [Nocardioides sp. cx-173]|uniref:HAD family hydrolase n=1 Tax=Nocardioides sp. cx-173 TaxID=2898796 RepID=UPI001E534E44|nr:HAD family phosphatase [Nocardioides sp. cx-173]MCD4526932.1 HAD family phosphatase [Nocardioides sp. cx-173]UGB41280.1 HAD family phosphatase [Nocardioides sp. cx-173]